MKTLFAFIAFTLVSAPAFAAPMSCRTKNSGPDHGLYASFSSDRREVEIRNVTIAGTEVLARLECFSAAGARSGGNLICRNFDSSGFVLAVKRSDPGKITAILSRLTEEGSQKIADMSCVAARH